jgi:phosphopantetheinyl transferase
MIVLAVVDDALSPDFPLGVDLEVVHPTRGCRTLHRRGARRRARSRELLRIEERELEAGGLN